LYHLYEMNEADQDLDSPLRLSVSDARRSLSDLVNTVAYGNRRVVLTRHGRDVAAIVSIVDLNRLEVMGQHVPAKPTRAAIRRAPRI
jgi:prevent-host-death family protein